MAWSSMKRTSSVVNDLIALTVCSGRTAEHTLPLHSAWISGYIAWKFPRLFIQIDIYVGGLPCLPGEGKMSIYSKPPFTKYEQWQHTNRRMPAGRSPISCSRCSLRIHENPGWLGLCLGYFQSDLGLKMGDFRSIPNLFDTRSRPMESILMLQSATGQDSIASMVRNRRIILSRTFRRRANSQRNYRK